jgi:hypothetical protein
MLKEVPTDIQRIILALLVQRMEVTGPTGSDERRLYLVNGHSLSEDELRALSRKQLLASWDILNYTRSRRASEVGNGIMTLLLRSRSERDGFSTARETKLLWCKRFHQKRRRRVAILLTDEFTIRYKVHCLKCGVTDVEITEFEKTKVATRSKTVLPEASLAKAEEDITASF